MWRMPGNKPCRKARFTRDFDDALMPCAYPHSSHTSPKLQSRCRFGTSFGMSAAVHVISGHLRYHDNSRGTHDSPESHPVFKGSFYG
jgi:hypothetical protein